MRAVTDRSTTSGSADGPLRCRTQRVSTNTSRGIDSAGTVRKLHPVDAQSPFWVHKGVFVTISCHFVGQNATESLKHAAKRPNREPQPQIKTKRG